MRDRITVSSVVVGVTETVCRASNLSPVGVRIQWINCSWRLSTVPAPTASFTASGRP